MKINFGVILSVGLLSVMFFAGCGKSTLDDIGGDSAGSVDIFNIGDGLADNNVKDIAVDYVFDGIWFATLNGISFYSNSDSTFFTYGAEFTGIPDMQNTSIHVDNSGTVWAGTEKGAAYLAPSDSLWKNITQLHGRYVTDIVTANDYSVYFATRNGLLVKSAQDNWTTHYNLGPSTDISTLEIGNSGNIWAGTTIGISVLDPLQNSWTMYGTSVLLNTYINVIYKDVTGAMWCGTTSVATKYDGESWVNYGVADGLPGFGINDFAEDNFGILWAATDVGVFFFAGNRWNSFDLPDQVVGEIVNTIEVDRKTGDMWIGTSNGAVVIYNFID